MTMRRTRPLLIFAALLAGSILLWMPAFFSPAYIDTLPGRIVAFPFISVYLFHMIGVPGLLVNNCACGWGWCAPTLFGWIFITVFWLLTAFLLALGIARLSSQD